MVGWLMSKEENIVKWIKGQSISWLGHLERMEEDRMTKKVFTQELEGTKRRGRPMKRMERRSRKRFSSAGSEKIALLKDRTKWRDIVQQAEAHNGL
jgi:hypothetical protein